MFHNVHRKLNKKSIHNVESRKYAYKTSTTKQLNKFVGRNPDSVHNMRDTLSYFPHRGNYNVDFPQRGKNSLNFPQNCK